MSTYGSPVATNHQYQNQHQAVPGRAAAGDRPAVLTAAVGAALGAAVLNIIGAVLMLTSVTDMVREQIAGSPDFGEEAVTPDQVDLTTDRAQGLETIFSSLAYNTIFWMLVLVPLAIFAARGGRATRVVSAVILVVTALFTGVILLLPVGGAVMAVGGLVSLLAIAAVVLFFLPASNAYGRQRRSAR
jgi:hypothetical protein